MKKETQDKLAYAIIFGTAAAAKGALKILFAALGRPLPDVPIGGYTNQARERAWAEYQTTGDILKALEKLFS